MRVLGGTGQYSSGQILSDMKTTEGYDVINVKEYDVVTSIYMKTEFNPDIREKGFSGVVKDPNIDDRFICDVFCIWNSKGELIHSSDKWGQFNFYKIESTKREKEFERVKEAFKLFGSNHSWSRSEITILRILKLMPVVIK